MVGRVGADTDDAVGARLMRRDVIGRQSVELVWTLEDDVPRVLADVPGVILAELRELGSQRAGAISFGRSELDAGAAHVSSRDLDESTLDRVERGRVDPTERVVYGPGLQLPLPELNGLALQLLRELLHRRVRVHRDVDAALTAEVVKLDLEIVERRDGRFFGERCGSARELPQEGLGSREPFPVARLEALRADRRGQGQRHRRESRSGADGVA